MTLREWLESGDLDRKLDFGQLKNMAAKIGVDFDVDAHYEKVNDEPAFFRSDSRYNFLKTEFDMRCRAILTQFQIQFGLDEEF